MAARRLGTALNTFARALKEAKDLADDALQWAIPPAPGSRAQITTQRRDLLTEIAFLRAFTGWEIFLEETFLLYLLGHQPPKGPAPRRYGFPGYERRFGMVLRRQRLRQMERHGCPQTC